jgi:hypothetical protein
LIRYSSNSHCCVNHFHLPGTPTQLEEPKPVNIFKSVDNLQNETEELFEAEFRDVHDVWYLGIGYWSNTPIPEGCLNFNDPVFTDL